MLLDLFTSLTTRCSPHIRALGYVDETIAMRKRYRARRQAWQPHLDRSKQFILASAQKCTNRNKLVLLGSGLLLDVPLARLASMFREVVLMDVVCLPEIREQIAMFDNVRFVEHDATDVSERLYANRQQALVELPDIKPPSSTEYENAGLVVSLNILSQLWVIPRAFMLKQRQRAGQEHLDDWCGKMVRSHFAFLRSLPCAVCLIADLEFVKRDKKGEIFSQGSTVYEQMLPKPETSWTWHISPLGSASGFYSKELNVGAWHLWPEQD
jgi:hypothetical protein